MEMTKATFIGKDQNWQEESTTYWFELSGVDYGTGRKFDNDVYGVIESSIDHSDSATIVDCDGSPLTPGDIETIAVKNSVTVTDEMKITKN